MRADPTAGEGERVSIARLGRELREGSRTSLALTEALLDRIAVHDTQLHAFVAICPERARSKAREADEELAAGRDRGPLHGIPFALKDIFDVAGLVTSCCSRLYAERRPREDSFVQRCLSDAGGVLLGKTTTHELALGGPCFDLPYAPARNPYDTDRFAGGSSSGSAVAVAAGFAPLTIGSDTSGSIRGPASYCGVVGLKPTYGLVSRRGVFPLSYSLDHCGPLTWSVEDAALALNVLAAHDSRDPSSIAAPAQDYAEGLGSGVDGLRIGYARRFFEADCAPDVLRAIDEAAQSLADRGAAVEEVELPPFELFCASGRVIMTAEAYAIHEEALRDRPLDFGRYTYQRLIPGAGVSAADYVQAQRLRSDLTRALNAGPLRQCHALICAVAMSTAPRLDSFGADWDPRTTMRSIPFTVTGNPAVAVPLGVGEDGLPIGLQLVGRLLDEARLLRIAACVEEAFRPHRRPPVLTLGEKPREELEASRLTAASDLSHA